MPLQGRLQGRLQGKTALVTGAGGGYGAAIAERFAAEGARVVCADIHLDNARSVAEGLQAKGLTAMAAHCDVGDGASVQRLVAEVVAVWGGFDILVNNAGLTQKPARIAKTPEADLDRLLAVNLKSIFHMAVHALPILRQRGGGNVINISSITGLRPRPGMTWYNATKAAVISVTQSMAAEVAPDHIRVNAIAPAAGRTAMMDAMFGAKVDEGIAQLEATIPLGRLAEPGDIANAAVYLASDEASFVTGVVLPVDGGRLVG